MSLGPIVVTNTGAVVRTVTQSSPVVTQNNGSTLVVQRVSAPVLQPTTNTVRQPIVRTQLLTDITVGPQGPKGDSGSASFVALSGAALTYPVVVTVRDNVANIADPTSVDDMSAQLAITTTATSAAGQSVTLITEGQLTDVGWSWTPGRVYLALTGGALTQTPDPTIGAILEVGRATSPTTIDFAIRTAILR